MADSENELTFSVTRLRGLAEYTILSKEEGSLYQGNIRRFGKDDEKVSFLLFQSEEEVSSIVNNLKKFTGEEFVVVKDLIKDSANGCYWLIVEHVTSLTTIQKTKAVWDKKRDRKRLNLPYRQILRDMIIGFQKLHEKETLHGPISASQIYIGLGGHGKLAHICGNAENWNQQSRSNDVAGLKELFGQILASNVKNKELRHFLDRFLDLHYGVEEKLFYHPLLMSDVERFYMPLITSTNMRHGTRYPNNAKGAKKFDSSFKPLDVDWWDAVRQHRAYWCVYRNGNYRRGRWSRFCYTRNCTQHITDDDITRELQSQGLPTMRGSRGAIAEKLSSFFEGHLLYVYDFFSLADFKSC